MYVHVLYACMHGHIYVCNSSYAFRHTYDEGEKVVRQVNGDETCKAARKEQQLCSLHKPPSVAQTKSCFLARFPLLGDKTPAESRPTSSIPKPGLVRQRRCVGRKGLALHRESRTECRNIRAPEPSCLVVGTCA